MSKEHLQAHQQEQARSLVEWTTFGISLGILLLLVGLLSYDYFIHEDKPVEVEVRPALDLIVQRKDSYYLPILVTNQGHEAARSVQVLIKLVVNGEQVEEGQVVIDFLAGQDVVEGMAVFDRNPLTGELQVELGFVIQ
jgi:uncharacterized protein (TIGR02588 family)